MATLTEAATKQKKVKDGIEEVVIEIGDVQDEYLNRNSYLAKTLSGTQPLARQIPASSLTQQQMFAKNLFLNQQKNNVIQEKPKQNNNNIFHGSAKTKANDDNTEQAANCGGSDISRLSLAGPPGREAA